MISDDELLDLFLHPGWKQFIADIEEARSVLIQTTHHLGAEHELWERKGQIQKLSEIVNFEHMTKLRIDEGMRVDDADVT